MALATLPTCANLPRCTLSIWPMRICPQCHATYSDDIPCARMTARRWWNPAWPEGTVIDGKYRILAKLGQDIACTVYKAVQIKPQQFRTLKVMSRDLACDPASSSFSSRMPSSGKSCGMPTWRASRASARLTTAAPLSSWSTWRAEPEEIHRAGWPVCAACVPAPSPSKWPPAWKRPTRWAWSIATSSRKAFTCSTAPAGKDQASGLRHFQAPRSPAGRPLPHLSRSRHWHVPVSFAGASPGTTRQPIGRPR